MTKTQTCFLIGLLALAAFLAYTTLRNMKAALNESKKGWSVLPGGLERTEVPGGWLYTKTGSATLVFVPSTKEK